MHGSDLPERHHELARHLRFGATSQSDKAKSLQLLERPHHSDQFRATQPGRSRGTTRERRLRSDTARSLARRRPGSDVFRATQPGRSRRNDPGATSRSDVPRSLHVYLFGRIHVFSRSFWSFHYARFYFLNLCFNTLGATKRGIIFVLRKTTKNLWKVISLNQLISLLLRILCSYLFPVFLYMINLKSNMGLRGIMEISE